MNKIQKYFLNILISFDQFVNTIFGGSPDETISSRLGRNYPNSLITKFVNFIFSYLGYPDGNHCADSIEPLDREKDAIIK